MTAGKSGRYDILDRVASVVLAGGQGTRLMPLTQIRCKPAVTFGGRYRLIDIPLSNSLNSGIRWIYVISQFYAAHLNQHILSTFHPEYFQGGGIELLCPQETSTHKIWFHGTADAVRQNLDNLLKTPVEYFLILSGDQLYNMNYRAMLEFAQKSGADLVIASIPVEELEARRMGLLKIDNAGHVADFVEKPNDPSILKKYEHAQTHAHKPLYLGSMGIYVFKREALVALLKEKGEDFGKQLIPLQVKKGKTSTYVFEGYWEDIGTIAAYYQANLALAMHKTCLDTYDESNPIYTKPHNLPSPRIVDTIVKDSLISQGAVVEAKEISRSVIGIRAHIKKGTIIRDSIVMGNHYAKIVLPPPAPKELSIGSNCLIQKAIIDEQTHIGNDVQLINKNNLSTFDGNGIFIRDGIIIVTTGTEVPDGFIL